MKEKVIKLTYPKLPYYLTIIHIMRYALSTQTNLKKGITLKDLLQISTSIPLITKKYLSSHCVLNVYKVSLNSMRRF